MREVAYTRWVITQLLPFFGYLRSLNALNAINEISPPMHP